MFATTAPVTIPTGELRALLADPTPLGRWLRGHSPLADVGWADCSIDDPIARWLRATGAQSVRVTGDRLQIDGLYYMTPRWMRRYLDLIDQGGQRPVLANEALSLLKRVPVPRPRSCQRLKVWQPGRPAAIVPIRVFASRRQDAHPWRRLAVVAAFAVPALYLAMLASASVDAVLAGRL